MDAEYPVLCAWCGTTINFSKISNSHGICLPCTAVYKGIPLLSEEQVAILPFGVIELNSIGEIINYNKAEEMLSGMSSLDVIGKNFFTEVAPCTKVQKFKGRFEQFITLKSEQVNFDFIFRFPGKTTTVNILFVRSERQSVYVLVKATSQISSPAS